MLGDNVDIEMRSRYGNADIHYMGRIRIIVPEPTCQDVVVPRTKLKPEEKLNLIKKNTVQLLPFLPHKINSLNSHKVHAIYHFT